MNVASVGPFSPASQTQTAMLASLVEEQQMQQTGASLAAEVSTEFGGGGTGGQAPGAFEVYA